ncbi:hypothetical protein EG346_05860 [Chryseobacterium carnipullorum]|uniref:YhhN-like protein n=1 Tax=Chryseobacterium carnipullorum TaxID=1124835 RepID=A0A376ENQ9_CHRCU|nr:hypothetical protein [Chryseobacterium carnipullorum]AZA47744.1 hypothetical protein EG346_05860 [Chryseobacterium carnipullorum]AZA67068.1 hypothetical protein EG345_22020 [Chryseobacterium carnipullorum]STD11687.1 Uncharacterised protein [Chryseobacterium carnipullorum]
MNWNIEVGKQISMVISVVVIVLMIIKSRKIGKENLFFIIGYVLLSMIDIFCYFYFKATNQSTEIFYVIGFLVIAFFLYLLYYYRLLYLPVLRKIQLVLLIIFAINIIVMFCIKADLLHHFSFSILYTDILLLMFSIILFLYQTFNSDKILDLNNYFPFWISVALLILFIGSIPIFYFRTTVSEHIYFFILFMLNFISNGILILGLILNKQARLR